MDTNEMRMLRDIRESYREASYYYMVENDKKKASDFIRKAIKQSRDLLFELGVGHENSNQA
jgi:hypothetical protein